MIQWHVSPQPQTPFIASIFNYYLSDDLDGYEEYDILTLQLAKKCPGFLGYESFKHGDRGSFISYWADMDAVQKWARNPIHIEAKKLGMDRWYRYYHSAIAEVKHLHSNAGRA